MSLAGDIGAIALGRATVRKMTQNVACALAAVHAAGEPGRARDVSRTIRVEARDIAFDIQTLTVWPGETIRVVVTNVGRIPHEFVIGTREEQAAHRKAMAGTPRSGCEAT